MDSDLDRETGEAVQQRWYGMQAQQQNGTTHTNAETGELEPLFYCTHQERPRKPFQVSKNALHQHGDSNESWGFFPDVQESNHTRDEEKPEKDQKRNKSQWFINRRVLALANMCTQNDSYMEEYYKRCFEQQVLQKSANMNSTILMLPVIFLFPFPASLTVIGIVIEICLHLWAHRRAKRAPEFQQFHSPLHEITSKFCAVCRISDCTNKISRLQERRKEKSRNYVERVSVMT